MTDLLDLPAPPPVPTRIKEHQVRTLPSLQAALADLMAVATDRGVKRVDLADADPVHGWTISLNDSGDGPLFVKFERKSRK